MSIKLATYTIKDKYRIIYINEKSLTIKTQYCCKCNKKLNEITFNGQVTYNKKKTIKFEHGSFHISHYSCEFQNNQDKIICIIKHPYNCTQNDSKYNKFGKWSSLYFFPSKKTIKNIFKYLNS